MVGVMRRRQSAVVPTRRGGGHNRGGLGEKNVHTYSVGKDVKHIQLVRDIPVQHIQSVGMYSGTKYSVGRDIF